MEKTDDTFRKITFTAKTLNSNKIAYNWIFLFFLNLFTKTTDHHEAKHLVLLSSADNFLNVKWQKQLRSAFDVFKFYCNC